MQKEESGKSKRKLSNPYERIFWAGSIGILSLRSG